MDGRRRAAQARSTAAPRAVLQQDHRELKRDTSPLGPTLAVLLLHLHLLICSAQSVSLVPLPNTGATGVRVVHGNGEGGALSVSGRVVPPWGV